MVVFTVVVWDKKGSILSVSMVGIGDMEGGINMVLQKALKKKSWTHL